MKRILIECLATALSVEAGAPEEFVYIPEGRHRIFPKSHPKGMWVSLKPERGSVVAAAFNADLAKRQKQNVAPWLDFEHASRGPSAGEPKSFRYEPGKGLMCSADWSAAGRSAIEGRDFRYFSGRFDLCGEEPCGLPERGPLGALVNEPAFREIPAITASEADQIEEPPIMSLLILASCGLLSQTEAALPNAEDIARARVTAMNADNDNRKKRIEELEAELAGLKKEKDVMAGEVTELKGKRAKDLVEAAVADGRIAPADETTKAKFIERITAGDSFAEEMLAQRQPTKDVTKTVVTAGQGRTNATGLEERARKLVEAGQAPNFEEAVAVVASEDPKAYNEYLATLS